MTSQAFFNLSFHSRTTCALAAHLRALAVCKALFTSPRGVHPRGAFYVIGRNFVLRKKRHSATSIHYTCTYPLRQVRTFFLSLTHPKSPLPCLAFLSHSQLSSPIPSFSLTIKLFHFRTQTFPAHTPGLFPACTGFSLRVFSFFAIISCARFTKGMG